MRAFLILLGVAGFVAFVVWDLRSHGRFECNVCVEFKGQTHCAVGSGPTREEAVRSGQTPACQILGSGVTDAFACAATPPASVTCTP